MATSLIDLNRITYLRQGGTPYAPSLSYLSAKYKNIKFLLPAQSTYVITAADAANLPGIAFKVYRNRDYWWVIGLYNGIIFPESDLQPGMILQLPALADINSLLSSEDSVELTNVVI